MEVLQVSLVEARKGKRGFSRDKESMNLLFFVLLCSCTAWKLARHSLSNHIFISKSISTGVIYSQIGKTSYTFKEPSEQELQEILDLAMGSDHADELKQKVTIALEEDYDLEQGVNPSRIKQLPLQANIDLWSYNARQSFLKGNYTGALRMYKKCVDYNPVDGRAWLGIARIHYKRGKYDLAESAYKDGLYYNPKNPFLMQSWAVMLEKVGRVNEAISLLTTSIKANPAHSASWVALANIKQQRGDIADARRCYESAIAGDKRSYVALQALGLLEYGCGNIDLARSLYRRSAEISSGKSAYALQSLAKLEISQGNLTEAEKILNQALRAWPNATRVRQALAEVFEMRGKVEEARSVFLQGEMAATKCGDAGFIQSWAMFELRQRDLSIGFLNSNDYDHTINERDEVVMKIRQLFRKAINVNKLHSASWIAWSKFEQKIGNYDGAKKLLITGISKFPHSKNVAWFHCCLGNLAYHGKDFNTARACYARALQSSPPQKSLSVLLEFAQMEIAYGKDPKEVRKLFDLALSRFPTSDRVWDSYILYETNLGKIRYDNEILQTLLQRRQTLNSGKAAEKSNFDSGKSEIFPMDDKGTDIEIDIDDAFNVLLDSIKSTR